MENSSDSTTEPPEAEFEWAVVEIMGHRRHAGRVREEDRFGTKMLRVDVPTLLVIHPEKENDQPTFLVEKWTTHWYGGPSIFSFTLTDEESVMRMNRPYYSPQRYIAPPDDPDFDEVEDAEGKF